MTAFVGSQTVVFLTANQARSNGITVLKVSKFGRVDRSRSSLGNVAAGIPSVVSVSSSSLGIEENDPSGRLYSNARSSSSKFELSLVETVAIHVPIGIVRIE
jgi:hypothetical protein